MENYGQRYLCKDCNKRFRLINYQHKNEVQEMWNEYVFSKQTLRELKNKFGYSKKQIRHIFKTLIVPKKEHMPRSLSLAVDTTFFGKRKTGQWGVVVFRDFKNKENLWWKFVDDETISEYMEGKLFLESLGHKIISVTCDGLPGLVSVFKEIPVQFCHFHQTQIIKRYVTENPKLIPGQELLELIKTLTFNNQTTFTQKLNQYLLQNQNFLNEKSFDFTRKRYVYKHRRLRSALRSLKRNLPFLFTYQEFPELNIPNTTNTLEAHFSHIKDVVRIHRGLTKNMKEKVLQTILLNSSIVLDSEKNN